jgi:hypothetical protein
MGRDASESESNRRSSIDLFVHERDLDGRAIKIREALEGIADENRRRILETVLLAVGSKLALDDRERLSPKS